ncbi:MAG: HigA family addiction module antitoxin [Opitutaceae bacterium]
MTRKNTLPPLTPGEMLQEEFLTPLELTPYRLAKDIGVPLTRITAILAGSRAITADTGLRLDRYFGLSAGWWLRLQTHCDLRKAQRELGERIEREVKPRSAAA